MEMKLAENIRAFRKRHLLMAGSAEYRGRIMLDDTELRDVAPESLYEIMSVIQQNVFVFNASIRDNVSMFRSFPQKALDEAISHAHLSELIEARRRVSLRRKRQRPVRRREAARFHRTQPAEALLRPAGG